MEVIYNVVNVVKGNKQFTENELKDIIAKKVLRIILANESKNVALNNS